MSADTDRVREAATLRGTYDRAGHVPDRDLTWEIGRGDRRLHDRVLAGLPRTPFIVNGTLADDAIRIRTAPADERRFRGEIIRFDSVVAPLSVRLNGPGMELHLVSAKVLVNMALVPGIGWCTSDVSVKAFFRSFLLLIRWMGANGIPCMAALKEAHYRLFEAQLTEGGLDKLYPVLPALDAFLAEVKAGRAALPTYTDGNRVRLSMEAIANRLGLARGRDLRTEARARILEVARSVCPEIVRRHEVENSRLGARVKAGEGLTASRVSEMLEPWQRLHDLRIYLAHDEIGYRAFTPLRSLNQVASTLGREAGRTRDIPYDVLGFLLDRALRWLDYSEYVRSVYTAVRSTQAAVGFWDLRPKQRRSAVRAVMRRELDQAPTGVGAPSAMIPEYSTFWGDVRGFREEGLDLRTVMTRLLPGACLILTATFSARRRIELESLKSGCVVHDDGPWLLAWIGKNVREVDRIPVPECVARAVEILEWLSEDGRRTTGEPWLHCFEELTSGGKVIEIKVVEAINDFARFVGLDEFHEGPPLALAPHQFRRAFAIIHFYRFKMPSLQALTEFLRHYDSEKTSRYLSKDMAGAYLKIIEERDASDEMIEAAKRGREAVASNARSLEQVGEDFLVEVLVRAERGEEPVVGKGGEALMLELRHFLGAASERIAVTTTGDGGVTPSLDELIRKFVREGKPKRIAHNPAGTSSCLCGSDPQRLSMANCLRRKGEREGPHAVVGAQEPDFAYAEPAECADCYNGVQLPEHERWMADYIQGQREVARTTTAPILRNATQRRVEKLERIRNALYGKSDGGSSRGRRNG